jgi:hypothetical protein
VVELVHYHHVELLGPHRGQPVGVKALNGGEDVPPLGGAPATHPHLAEGAVGHYRGKGGPALLEYLPPVGHKQQRQPAELLHQPSVVQGGDNGLARTGGGDHKVAPVVVHLALDVQLVEHCLLVGVGADFEASDRDARLMSAGCAQGLVQAGAVPVRVVGFEPRVGPVGVEGGGELGQKEGCVASGEADVPLKPVDQGGSGQVG